MGLPELLILGQVELEDHFEVTVRYRRDKVPCPRCGSVMVKKHESEFQRKKDRKLRDKTGHHPQGEAFESAFTD
jgi:ribosomal protein S27AE